MLHLSVLICHRGPISLDGASPLRGHPYVIGFYQPGCARHPLFCQTKFHEDSTVCEALIFSCALQDLDWFWEMVGEMGDERRRELLCFWTSMSTVPAGMLHPTPIFQHVYTAEHLDRVNCTHTHTLMHIMVYFLLVASCAPWQSGIHTSLLLKDSCCPVACTLASNVLAFLTIWTLRQPL